MRSIEEIVGSAEAGSAQHEPEVAKQWQRGDCIEDVCISTPALEDNGLELLTRRVRVGGNRAQAYLLFPENCGQHTLPIASCILVEDGDHTVAVAEEHRRKGLASAMIAESLWDAFERERVGFSFVPATRYTEGGHAAFKRAAKIFLGWI